METLDRTMSNMVAFVQKAAGAVRRHVLDKLRDLRPSVLDFGADPTGAADSTAAFASARTATSGNYYISTGVYKVQDLTPFSDRFSAGAGVVLNVAGAGAYDLSRSFSGRFALSGDGNVLSVRDALTGNTFATLSASGAIGFFGSYGTTRPVVTGATKDIVVANLCAALANLGLITNNTTYTAPTA